MQTYEIGMYIPEEDKVYVGMRHRLTYQEAKNQIEDGKKAHLEKSLTHQYENVIVPTDKFVPNPDNGAWGYVDPQHILFREGTEALSQ